MDDRWAKVLNKAPWNKLTFEWPILHCFEVLDGQSTLYGICFNHENGKLFFSRLEEVLGKNSHSSHHKHTIKVK